MLITDSAALGKMVRDARREAGLTQAEAAELMGVGRRLLIELERGKREASITTVIKVLRYLGLELHAQSRRSRFTRHHVAEPDLSSTHKREGRVK